MDFFVALWVISRCGAACLWTLAGCQTLRISPPRAAGLLRDLVRVRALFWGTAKSLRKCSIRRAVLAASLVR